MSTRKLKCITANVHDGCGTKRYGCSDISAMRFTPAGPAVHTGEWDIGVRECAGNLQKCVGKCGNTYCSATGTCDKDISHRPFISENYCAKPPYTGHAAIGVL